MYKSLQLCPYVLMIIVCCFPTLWEPIGFSRYLLSTPLTSAKVHGLSTIYGWYLSKYMLNTLFFPGSMKEGLTVIISKAWLRKKK